MTRCRFAGQGEFGFKQIVVQIVLMAVLVSAAGAVAAGLPPDSATHDELEIGRRIYMEGVLPSGAALSGLRHGNTLVAGAEAACVNCHRPSGMGQVEGDIQVPPIAGNFLFASKSEKHLALMDPRVSKALNQAHDPYAEATLAEAILHGRNIQGREMNVAMPRYSLSPSELSSLTAYLRQLSTQWSPGVGDHSIRFATVMTPDVDPERRKVTLDMMRSIIRQKNASTEVAVKGKPRRHMTSAAEFVLGTERTWELDIWELQGAPDTWEAQLLEKYRSQPVFALISGVSSSTWQPVHDFCEHEKIPCWFPSVDLPVKQPSQYSLYFSGGVLLEANVLAHHLLNSPVLPKRVIQIYRNESVGRGASQELAHALEGSSIKVENWPLNSGLPAAESWQSELKKQKPGDTVVYWLRKDDIASLSRLKPVHDVDNYFSSRLANAEQAPLSREWRKRSHMVYLYELPERREANLAYFHSWLNMHKFPLVDEALQTEVFFAMNYLTDTAAEMLNNLYRDYLVERAETMMDKREGSKSEQETRDRWALGRPGDLDRKHGETKAKEESRLSIIGQSDAAISHGTTIYPHLSLGPGQRFSSKGGYIVRFADDRSEKLVAESAWIVP